jgi:hypothetical protein
MKGCSWVSRWRIDRGTGQWIAQRGSSSNGARSPKAEIVPHGAPVPERPSGRVLRDVTAPTAAAISSMPLRSGQGSASGIFSAASAMAVRSLGPPTTMSFRLAIGH